MSYRRPAPGGGGGVPNNNNNRKASISNKSSPKGTVGKNEILEHIEELSRRMDEMRRQQDLSPRYSDDMRRVQNVGDMMLTRPPSFAFPNPEEQQLQRMNSFSRFNGMTNNNDEPLRVTTIFENEAKERRKAELKILELTGQLEDARRGLRETQNALMDVQHAAEVLTQKRDERNAQFQKILMENKTIELFELEMQIRNSDKVSKSSTVASDDRISRLQDELNITLEGSHKHQAECTRLKTEKARLEAEVENYQRKTKSMESSHRHAEIAQKEEHDAEIIKLEDRLRTAMGQADEGRKNDIKLLDSKTDLYNKINELKNTELKLVEVDAMRRQLEQKTTSMELNIHHLESQNRQKDVRINQLEQEALACNSEMNLLKSSIAKKDEEINNFIQESFDITAKFDQLRKVNKELERKLASINVEDYNDQISRLKIDCERRDSQIKQLTRTEEDLNRQIKALREDNTDLEDRVKSVSLQLSASQSSDSETRQSLKISEQALNELKADKVSLTWKLNVEEKRANRLEETLRRAALTKGINMPGTASQGNAYSSPTVVGQKPFQGGDSMSNQRGGKSVNFASPQGDVSQEFDGPSGGGRKEIPKPRSIMNVKPTTQSPPQSPVAPKTNKGSILGGLNFMRRAPA